MDVLDPFKCKLESTSAVPINDLEIYILSNVLSWRLSFPTPYDFIVCLTQEIVAKTSALGSPMMRAAEKAKNVSELLLLCTPALDCG